MRLSELQRIELTKTGRLQDVAYAAFLDPDIRIIQRSGSNTDIDTTTTPEDVWGGSGMYTGFPSTAETLSIVSASANDTAAGSGARTLRISGLDSVGNFLTEIVTLNGTTPVVTTNAFLRMNRAIVLTSGDNNTAFNAGAITINHSTTTSNVFGIIDVNTNMLKTTAYTIPKGTAGVIRNIAISGLRGTASFNGVASLYIRPPTEAPRLELSAGFSSAQSFAIIEAGGIYVPELTDIIIRITNVSSNNAVIDANLELYVIRQ